MFNELLIVFFVIILIIFLLVFPFKIRILAHVNLLELKGFYSGKVAGIKIIEGIIFSDSTGKLEMKNSANLLSKNIDENFTKCFGEEIIKKIYVNDAEVFIVSGFVEDSYLSAILSGGISAIIKSVYSFLSFEYEDSKLVCDIKPVFDESKFELSVKFVASITLFKTIVALLKSFKKLKELKEAKNGK